MVGERGRKEEGMRMEGGKEGGRERRKEGRREEEREGVRKKHNVVEEGGGSDRGTRVM